jgi:hypothetical protein
VLGKGRTGNAGVAKDNQNYGLRLVGAGGKAGISFLFRGASNRPGKNEDWHRWDSEPAFAVGSFIVTLGMADRPRATLFEAFFPYVFLCLPLALVGASPGVYFIAKGLPQVRAALNAEYAERALQMIEGRGEVAERPGGGGGAAFGLRRSVEVLRAALRGVFEAAGACTPRDHRREASGCRRGDDAQAISIDELARESMRAPSCVAVTISVGRASSRAI